MGAGWYLVGVRFELVFLPKLSFRCCGGRNYQPPQVFRWFFQSIVTRKKLILHHPTHHPMLGVDCIYKTVSRRLRLATELKPRDEMIRRVGKYVASSVSKTDQRLIDLTTEEKKPPEFRCLLTKI